MSRIQPRNLSGFMELLPHHQIYFQRMVDLVHQVYQSHGFYPLDTPIIEASEVLLAKGGGETEKQIYRFQKGDHDLSLRFDLTVPLAKYVALHQGDLAFPFRRYQIGKVYRGERAQRGRYREFYQADIDIVGNETLAVANDGLMPVIIAQVFQSMGLENFRIRINNRKILTGFYQLKNLADKSTQIMQIVDKLDKIGREEVEKLLEQEGISQGKELLDFLTLSGTNEEIQTALQDYVGQNETFDTGVAELKEVFACIHTLAPSDTPFCYEIDLTIARGLDYYTGTVYETILQDHPEIGSICSGGRYDNLADYYTNKKLPGVGISIGLTRLFSIMEERGYLNPNMVTAPCHLLLVPMDLEQCLTLATDLLKEHPFLEKRCQIYLEGKKMKQIFAYADKLHIPYVAIIGEEEVKNGTVTLKNMATGQQITGDFRSPDLWFQSQETDPPTYLLPPFCMKTEENN